jgi:hypothetical protein
MSKHMTQQEAILIPEDIQLSKPYNRNTKNNSYMLPTLNLTTHQVCLRQSPLTF